MTSDRFTLAGKAAVVSGASSGLGARFAAALAEAGCDVAIGARRENGLARTAEEVRSAGRRCAELVTDVSVPEDCERLAAHALAELGRIDVVVCCAGAVHVAPALKEKVSEFERVVAVNLTGSFSLAQACARRMEAGGSIILVGSILAEQSSGLPHASYAASKAAVAGLGRDLAVQWTRRRGIRVNTLVPGYVRTEMTAGFDEAMISAIAARVPAGRMAEPDELVGPLLFLASGASSYVTGATLVVDGGALAA